MARSNSKLQPNHHRFLRGALADGALTALGPHL